MIQFYPVFQIWFDYDYNNLTRHLWFNTLFLIKLDSSFPIQYNLEFPIQFESEFPI